MKECVNKICSRLQLTIDIWKNSNLLSFLAVTGHYICQRWSYQSFVLDLVLKIYPHTGEEISKQVQCLKQVKIETDEEFMELKEENKTDKIVSYQNKSCCEEIKEIPFFISRVILIYDFKKIRNIKAKN
ncbi:hypothetical protein ABPG72_020382 [Tetrahymena utriculariae]